jgi:hypothetical protein
LKSAFCMLGKTQAYGLWSDDNPDNEFLEYQ